MNGKNYDLKLKNERILKKLINKSKNEAEALRFESKLKNEEPKVRVRYGLSDIDPLTNEKYFWDLWVKFPFKLKKDQVKLKLFESVVNEVIQNIFLS